MDLARPDDDDAIFTNTRADSDFHSVTPETCTYSPCLVRHLGLCQRRLRRRRWHDERGVVAPAGGLRGADVDVGVARSVEKNSRRGRDRRQRRSLKVGRRVYVYSLRTRPTSYSSKYNICIIDFWFVTCALEYKVHVFLRAQFARLCSMFTQDFNSSFEVRRSN